MAACIISRATATFVLLSLVLAVVLRSSYATDATCSRNCIAEHCDTLDIKYGKYCGVGYFGCPGEKPCDGLDACCMGHDECVTVFGMTHVKCHKRLKNCLIREQKTRNVGFSKECPYNRAAPTMIRGMDLAILLSQLNETFHD
ncbi:phospholipase A2-beta-like [Lotus japonicus]|uniref:phospholipase A2-beta-like n=1 Tax=Lotus japonicus TaxID=34305 RepID=UPI002585E03B|nr:phospholipase A2-beta-like [Lotus japonicus]